MHTHKVGRSKLAKARKQNKVRDCPKHRETITGKATIEVMVSNIGCVYSGVDEIAAKAKYDLYVEASQHEEGSRAFGESVTLLNNGEIEFEFAGSHHLTD